MRRSTQMVLGGIGLVVIVSCGAAAVPQSSSPNLSAMPSVTGLRLDAALSDIKRAGFETDVEVLGGGTFGIIVESNWVVCEQVPPPGEALTNPRLTVGRECANLVPTPSSLDAVTSESPTTFPESVTPTTAVLPVLTPTTLPTSPLPTMALIPAVPTFAPVDPAPPVADIYFANCAEAEAAGMAPLFLGEPGYRRGLDRDHDGIACDQTG